MIYKVNTNQGTYYWGSNQANWQSGFSSRFPGISITGATPIPLAQAPATYQSSLKSYAAATPTATPSPATAPAAAPINPVQAAGNAIQDAVNAAWAALKVKAADFDAKNPFAFDEALATNKAAERIDPYYTQKLSDFMQGLETTRRRSAEDQQNILSELKATTDSYTGRAKMELDRAINASKEGFADAGLFFSGQRLTTEGQQATESNMNMADFLRNQQTKEQQTNLGAARTLETTGQQETMGRRDIRANQTFDINQAVNQSRLDAQTQHQLELRQYLGPLPGETPADFTNSIGGIEKALL